MIRMWNSLRHAQAQDLAGQNHTLFVIFFFSFTSFLLAPYWVASLLSCLQPPLLGME